METITKVGMREFRAHLPQYLQASAPIAVTRQGETIGYYMPTRPMPEQIERDALKVAALRLESMLLAQ
jgi:hypothetical protein